MKILYVCLGNICRSPTAEAVTRHLLEQHLPEGRAAGSQGEAAADGISGGLVVAGREFLVDSAGTGDWHIGSPADDRATEADLRRGIRIEGRARQVSAADFNGFDLLVAMDRSNQNDLLALAPGDEEAGKVRLMREFADGDDLDVPDPYYGGPGGFDEVLDIVERNARALLDSLDIPELPR